MMKKSLRNIVVCCMFGVTLLVGSKAQACEPGNPYSSDYMRRDDNRCEGIKQIPISGGLSLVGLYTYDTSIPNNGDNILLRIPYINSNTQSANEYIQQTRNNYVLNEISWNRGSSSYYFYLEPQVMERERILPNSLRAYATLSGTSIHVPVVMGDLSQQYRIAFLADRPAKINKVYIANEQGNILWERNTRLFEDGEINFSWNGRDSSGDRAPDGQYRLVYEYQLQNVSKTRSESAIFIHQNRWLN